MRLSGTFARLSCFPGLVSFFYLTPTYSKWILPEINNATAVRARAGARTPPRAGFDHSRKASSADTPAAACRAADELAREGRGGLSISFASALCVKDAANVNPPPLDSPKELRGKVVTANTLCVAFGQFSAGMVDGVFADVNEGRRWMLGLGAVPGFVMFVGFLGMPESPRFLVQSGRREAAKKVLRDYRAAGAHEELESIEVEVLQASAQQTGFFSQVRCSMFVIQRRAALAFPYKLSLLPTPKPTLTA